LRIAKLTPTAFDAQIVATTAAPPGFTPDVDGVHTLAACGDWTLFDAKRISRAPGKWTIEARRLARRITYSLH